MLSKSYDEDKSVFEVGVDEAGRGPLFGRVYASAVVLPKGNTSFDFSKLKDSKKFHSKKKINEVADYIKSNALFYSVTYADESVVDEINILQATQKAMHDAIKEVISASDKELQSYLLMIDGTYFNSLNVFNKRNKKIETIPHKCVQGGDNRYASIAAASILAKVERDAYIDDLCIKYPFLSEHYSIDKNKGYGAKLHIEGINKFGITQWHRKTFGICKKYVKMNDVLVLGIFD
tara:strand:- start:3661 stop:4362 length:702 start_codon:yes stop_codon:yes gene_type:complete